MIGAIIGAAAGLGGSILNAGLQNRTNQQQLAFNREMYDKQKQDSLMFWNMQNDYNSPVAQMQRLREAGLNPNLVYGKGADNTAMAIGRPAPGSYNPKAPQVDFSSIPMMAGVYADLKMKQAQTDNLRTQNTVLAQDALLKQAGIAKTWSETAKTDQEREQAQSLFAYNMDALKAKIRGENAATDVLLNRDQREAIMQGHNINTALANLAKVRAETTGISYRQRERIDAQLNNIQSDTRLKQLDGNLREAGIGPNDPFWMRLVAQIAAKYGLLGAAYEGAKGLGEGLKGFLSDPAAQILGKEKKLFATPGGWRK